MVQRVERRKLRASRLGANLILRKIIGIIKSNYTWILSTRNNAFDYNKAHSALMNAIFPQKRKETIKFLSMDTILENAYVMTA